MQVCGFAYLSTSRMGAEKGLKHLNKSSREPSADQDSLVGDCRIVSGVMQPTFKVSKSRHGYMITDRFVPSALR
jgi:hypothetical protein